MDDEMVEDSLIPTGVLDLVGPSGELGTDESGLGLEGKAGNPFDHGLSTREVLGDAESLMDFGMELSG